MATVTGHKSERAMVIVGVGWCLVSSVNGAGEWWITLHWLWLATWKLVETKTFDRDMETFRKHFPSVLFAWIRKCKNTM